MKLRKLLTVFIFLLCVIVGILIFNKTKNIELCTNDGFNSNYLILVNKENPLDNNYEPEKLVNLQVVFVSDATEEEKMMNEEAAKALEKLFKEAQKCHMDLYGVSAYRSYKTQKNIYNQRVKSVGKTQADKYVAIPGKSEHQTGLAIDVTNREGYEGKLKVDFGQTKEGKWLKSNGYNYGFIMRYPSGKEDITGYNYESWHIRYVGKEDAKNIYDKQITLEEYLNNLNLNY